MSWARRTRSPNPASIRPRTRSSRWASLSPCADAGPRVVRRLEAEQVELEVRPEPGQLEQAGQVLDRPVEMADDDARQVRAGRREVVDDLERGRAVATGVDRDGQSGLALGPGARPAGRGARRAGAATSSRARRGCPGGPRSRRRRRATRPRTRVASSSTDASAIQAGCVWTDVGAAAHDDVDAGRARDPGERRRRPADPVLGQVDQRPATGRLEARELTDGEPFAGQADVVGVARPVLADPAEVGQRQRLVEARLGPLLGEGVQLDQEVLMRAARPRGSSAGTGPSTVMTVGFMVARSTRRTR